MPGESSLRAIFFDVGDTLVFDNPSLAQRMSVAFGVLGYSIPDAYVAEGLRKAEEYILPLYVDGHDTDAPAMRRRALELVCAQNGVTAFSDSDWQRYAEAYVEVEFERYVHPEAAELLDFLARQDVHLGIISDWDPGLSTILEQLGIADYFDSMSVSEIVGARKPARALFTHALQQSGVEPAETLHIGDFYELDYLGATGAGMNALLFDWRNRTAASGIRRATTFSEISHRIVSQIMFPQDWGLGG